MDHRKKQYVQSLGLIPFPQEGGYFKETNDSIAKQNSNARARWQRAEYLPDDLVYDPRIRWQELFAAHQ